MHVNDIVLGGTLRYLDTDMRLVGQWKPGTPDHQATEFHSDPRLLDAADAALDEMGITHITGTIASGNYFVDTPEQVEARWRAPRWPMWRPATTCPHWSSAR